MCWAIPRHSSQWYCTDGKKGGSHLAPKPVVIENSSPHVEKRARLSEGADSARGDRSAALYHCCSGRDNIIPLSFGPIYGEISPTAGRIDSESDYPRNITGRQISYVFDSNMSDSLVWRNDHANNANRLHTQISSLEQPGITRLPTGESFDKSQLTLASFPQSPCRTPKCESEDGNQYSPERKDVLVIGTLPEKTEKPRDPFKEGGTGLLVGIVVGGLILAYQYAKGQL